MRRWALPWIVLASLAGVARAAPVTFAAAQAEAVRRDRPLVVEVGASWCGPCHVFEHDVLGDAGVQAALAEVVFARFDLDDDEGGAVARRFGVSALPTFLVVDRGGLELRRVEGIGEVGTPAGFLDFLATAHELAGAESTADRAADAAWQQSEQALAQARRAAVVAAAVAFVEAHPASGSAAAALERAVLSGDLDHATVRRLLALRQASLTDGLALAELAVVAVTAAEPEIAIACAEAAARSAARLPVVYVLAAYALEQAGAHARAEAILDQCGALGGAFDRARCAGTAAHLALVAAARATVAHYFANLEHPEAAVVPAAARAERVRVEQRDRAELAPRAVRHVTATLRLASGDAERYLLGATALLPLVDRDVQPMVSLAAELGAAADGGLAYQARAMLGFAASQGHTGFGFYAGGGLSRTGDAIPRSFELPLELALSTRGVRYGFEGWVRTTVVSAAARQGGSEHAPIGADELSLGFGVGLPFGARGLLCGLRYDERMHGQTLALWLGTDLWR